MSEYKAVLRHMPTISDDERQKRLAACYRLLLGLAARHKASSGRADERELPVADSETAPKQDAEEL